MLRYGPHCVVADTSWDCSAEPGWIAQQRVESAVAAIVQINVDSTVECQYEITNSVCSLNGERVVVKGFQEPRIFRRDEFSRFSIRPQLRLS